ncbi:hypothetical protein [Polycladidibacter stylochi]|uniref:hypothetical protein n=1 Tax=Polycladidibacter stylochi TaxID=1807766 RepID=UPI0008367BC8|nr:hypothetical protein [Pseudovibrio stylochi]
MGLYNVMIQNGSSAKSTQNWQIILGEVQVYYADLAFDKSTLVCAFDSSKIDSFTVCVNGNVAAFSNSAATKGADKDKAPVTGDVSKDKSEQDDWQLVEPNAYYSLSANGANLTIACTI